MNYSYPISTDWSTEEIVAVVQFFEAIEKAHEGGVARDELKARYDAFKKVVPSMSEEKSLSREFEKDSGYVAYNVIKQLKENQSANVIKIK